MALQTGVFNVTDNTYGFEVLPTNTATKNTTNLQNWVNLLLDAVNGPTKGQGGTLQFPSVGTYKFNGTITIGHDPSGTKQPYSILLIGTGQGQINAPILEQTSGSFDLFVVDNNPSGGGDQNIGGIGLPVNVDHAILQMQREQYSVCALISKRSSTRFDAVLDAIKATEAI